MRCPQALRLFLDFGWGVQGGFAPSSRVTTTNSPAGEKAGNGDLTALIWAPSAEARSPAKQAGIQVALILWVWWVGLRLKALIIATVHFWCLELVP